MVSRICTTFAIALVLLASCERKRYDSVRLYPVRGKVLFDGKPAVGAEVRLHPETPSGKGALYPAARVEADGSFALTTYENKDGAPTGEYAVTVRWDEATTKDEATPPDRLRGRYADPKKSPWRVTVRDGTNELEPFHLRK